MESLLSNLDNILLMASAAIGGLVLVVRGLHELAALTKTEKDDAILAKISAGLEKVAGLLSKVTPSPDKPKE